MVDNRFVNKIITEQEGFELSLYREPGQFFQALLTDDGSDATLNENYAAATDCYFTATRPCVIQELTITVIDGDVAQNALTTYELFVGATAALTNGFKFLVEKSDGTARLTINSVGYKTVAELAAFCTSHTYTSIVSDATSGNNSSAFSGRVNFKDKFGAGIALQLNDRFVCVLQDDLSGMAVVRMSVNGFYL